MKILLFLILWCIFTLSVGNPEIPLCNQGIISNIKQYWNEHGGPPTGILDSYINNGVEFAYASTDKYFTYDTNCVHYKDYSPQNGIYRTTVHMHYTDRSPTSDDVDAHEQNGVTVEAGDGVLRFHVFVENGVYCIYTCSNGGPYAKENLLPDAVIKMSKSHPDHGVADKCIGLLNSWGIHINRFYSDACTDDADVAPSQPHEPLTDYYGHDIDEFAFDELTF